MKISLSIILSLKILLIVIMLIVEKVIAFEPENLTYQITSAELSNNLRCSELGPRLLNFRIQESEYILSMPELIETNLIKSELTCTKLIRLWKKFKYNDKDTLTLTLYPAEKRSFVEEIYRFNLKEFTNFCFDMGLCLRNILDVYNIDAEITSCQVGMNATSLLKKIKPKIKSPNYKYIPNVNIEEFPRSSFTKRLIQLANSARKGATFAATMNLGGNTYNELTNTIASSRGPVFIAVDATLLLADNATSYFLNQLQRHRHLKVIPITTGLNHSMSFHWKLLFNEGDTKSIFSSLNLSTPGKLPYIDLMYNINNPEVSAELQYKLIGRMREQCENIEHFMCMVKFYEDDVTSQEIWQKLVTNNCNDLKKVEYDYKEKKYNQDFFLSSGESDIEYSINKLINSAKEEVIIMVHKFNVDSIYQSLIKAAERSVKVYVIVESETPFKNSKFISRFYDDANQQMPAPHMKIMLIDRQTLFFGNGNFTNSGLKYSDELFAITKDKNAIAKISNIAKNYLYYLKENKLNIQSSMASKKAWLFTAPKLNNLEAIKSTLLKYSTKFKDPIKKHYLELNPLGAKVIDECGLRDLEYISAHSFLACVLKQKFKKKN